MAIKLVAGKLGWNILEGDKRAANKHVNRNIALLANVNCQFILCILALSTPPRITIGFPMQNAEGPNSAKLSKNREFFENQ